MTALSHDSVDAALARVRFIGFDFDGVFTDNGVWVDQEGREMVRCTRADGIGLSRLRELGIGFAIVSTEPNPVVRFRAEKLRTPCVHDCKDKVAALKSFLDAAGLDFSQAAFVGNDVNDRAVLSAVAMPIVVADAHPDVRPLARLVTSAPGGHGAVREICDLIAAIHAKVTP